MNRVRYLLVSERVAQNAIFVEPVARYCNVHVVDIWRNAGGRDVKVVDDNQFD